METAASASKKRKLCDDDHHHHHDGDDQEDDEEEKMEKFFALVRSIRDARDRLMINTTSCHEKNLQTTKMKRKLEEDLKPVVHEPWKPTFQREDFLEDERQPDDQLKKPDHVGPQSSSSSQSKQDGTDQKAEDIKEGLDLRLSL